MYVVRGQNNEGKIQLFGTLVHGNAFRTETLAEITKKRLEVDHPSVTFDVMEVTPTEGLFNE